MGSKQPETVISSAPLAKNAVFLALLAKDMKSDHARGEGKLYKWVARLLPPGNLRAGAITTYAPPLAMPLTLGAPRVRIIFI